MLQRKELKIEKNPTKRVANKKDSSYNHSGDSACHIKEGIEIMASHKNVSASLHDDKGTWVVRARVYDPNTGKTKNKSKSTGLKVKDNTKRKAERAMREIAEQWEKEANAIVVSADPHFKESINLWLEKKSNSITDTSLYLYTYQAERYIIPALGSFKTKELRLAHIQRFYNNLLTHLNVKTVKLCHHIIRGALTDAVRAGIITNNFAEYAEFPRESQFSGQSYTIDQVKELLTVAKEEGEPYYTAILLGVVYGLRRSEICGLRWCDIDFDEGTLHICHTMVQVGAETKSVERTKTRSSNRVIWLIESTVPCFQELKQQQLSKGIDATFVCTRINGEKRGEPLKPPVLNYRLSRIIDKAGLQHVRLHDLRHTAASLLAEEATPKQVQNFLGHSNISTTMDIYTHTSNTQKAKTSSIMNQIIANEAIF